MPPAKVSDNFTTAVTWLGAPPVAENEFACANDDFFVEVSDQRRHRRATVGELKELITTGADQGRPAHWFEAQLAHYGLKRSKTKSVARGRLLDAFKADKLTIPAHLLELEIKLRRRWEQHDMAARRQNKIARRAAKASDDSQSCVESPPLTPMPTTHRDCTVQGTKCDASKSTALSVRGRGVRQSCASQGTSRRTLAGLDSSIPASSPDQNAQRNADSASCGSNDDDDDDRSLSCTTAECFHGIYTLVCADANREWPQHSTSYSLIFKTRGSETWGTFDLGMMEGIMHFPKLPKQFCDDRVLFRWRGEVSQGGIMYGDWNKGWVKFLTYGKIEGKFDYRGLAFRGRRRPGPLSANSIDVVTMQDEWDGYNEDRQ